MFDVTVKILSFFLVLATMVSCEEPTPSPSFGTSKCSDAYDAFDNCALNPNTNFAIDASEMDREACEKCEVEYGLYVNYQNNNYTCAEATAKVCGYFDQCGYLCYPKSKACVEETSNYYTCTLGFLISPPDCVVKCESPVLDGSDESGKGGGNDSDDNKDSVSGATTTSFITMFGIVSAVLATVVGLS